MYYGTKGFPFSSGRVSSQARHNYAVKIARVANAHVISMTSSLPSNTPLYFISYDFCATNNTNTYQSLPNTTNSLHISTQNVFQTRRKLRASPNIHNRRLHASPRKVPQTLANSSSISRRHHRPLLLRTHHPPRRTLHSRLRLR